MTTQEFSNGFDTLLNSLETVFCQIRINRLCIYLTTTGHNDPALCINKLVIVRLCLTLFDRLAAYELDQALQAFFNAGGRLPLPERTEPKLFTARWLLEELRISLFAQTLGTSETVSLQRVKKLLV